MHENHNKGIGSSSTLCLSFAHSLYYKHKEARKGLGADEQIFEIDGKPVPYYYHPLSLHATRSKKSRPRVQLTEEHAVGLKLTVVNETSTDHTKVVFPNGRVNHVLLARRYSKCPVMLALHEYMEENGRELDVFLNQKKKFIKDDLAGGRYIASGFGNMGRNVSPSIRDPVRPALRKCLKKNDHEKLARLVGGAFSHVAACIGTHCGNVFAKNQRIMEINKNLCWPPLSYQDAQWNWISSQFIIRRWGSSLVDWPHDEMIVSAHTDTGDLDCTMFHLYTSGGGRRGLGGSVPGTDLAVFENSEGGPGYRVKTCIEDTVVILVLDSGSQLHGCIKSQDEFVGDDLAWSTRIVPFIPRGVYSWMTRNPTGVPYMNIP